MPDKVIISDSSSLIALTNIGELELLRELYGQLVITPEIQHEFGIPPPAWINIERVNDENKLRLLNLVLDKGESSGIALALERNHSLLIIDEKKGRGIAKSLGIKIIGLLGIILKAKEVGVIDKVEPIIEKLEKESFRMSQKLKSQLLKRAGEDPIK